MIKDRLILLKQNHAIWDSFVTNNINRLSLRYLFLLVLVLFLIAFFFIINGNFSVEAYTQSQKELFLYLNSKLSSYSSLQNNITHLGDVIVFLPFFTILMVYAPKFWESLIMALLVSSVVSNPLKRFFAVPRPPAIFDADSFVVIGKPLFGSTSLPSGHSIAAFTILVSVYIAFLPKRNMHKIAWALVIFAFGFFIAISRVAVGAHYPLDVLTGAIIGSIAAISGGVINRKIRLFTWIKNKKYYFIFIILFFICAIVLIHRIITSNLVIFYFSLASLILTLFVMTYVYVKK